MYKSKILCKINKNDNNRYNLKKTTKAKDQLYLVNNKIMWFFKKNTETCSGQKYSILKM